MEGRMMPGLSLDEILAILPHRYPFLLVDRIIEVEERRVVGIKNVTINEPFFPGHIPGFPVMPGVLVVEAMAQVGGRPGGGASCFLNPPHRGARLAYLAGIDRCRFRRPVVPGDTLRIDVELRALRGRLGKIWGVARVGDEVAAEAEISFALPDAERAGGAPVSEQPEPMTSPLPSAGTGRAERCPPGRPRGSPACPRGRRRPRPGEPLVCWPARAGCPKCWRAPCAPGAPASCASTAWR